MKYLRVVLAVEEADLTYVDETLDEFIETCDGIQGAHVSTPYATREEATGADWQNK